MIRVRNLAKYYGGKRALGPVSFEIDDGDTVGFLGLNGAGKTTALRILACDLRPSAGSVTIGAVDAIAHPHEVRRHVGFLPESPPLYPDMTVESYLAFAGQLRGMRERDVARRLDEVYEATDLADVRDELIRNLSHGYRQRVGVAQAIIHRPKLLILDEPTRGLDPVQIVGMRELIHRLKAHHTVLISSHILTEISETCDHLLVLHDGAIVASGSEDDLSAELAAARRYVVGVRPKEDAADPAAIAALLQELPGVSGVTEVAPPRDEQGTFFEVAAADDVRAAVSATLVAAGHGLIKLDRAQNKLEATFLGLVQGAPPPSPTSGAADARH